MSSSTPHKKLHSFTATTDHDFTGLVFGESIIFDGTNIVSTGLTLQNVMDNGSTATVTTDTLIARTDGSTTSRIRLEDILGDNYAIIQSIESFSAATFQAAVNAGTSMLFGQGLSAIQQLTFDGSSMTVSDTGNEQGLLYSANYHANYTDRSLVDREYVTNHVATGLTLSDVVDNGNTLSDGQTIDAANGGGQIDLRYGGSNGVVAISNDYGNYSNAILYLQSGYTELSDYTTDSRSYNFAYTQHIDGFNAQFLIRHSSAGLVTPFANTLTHDIGSAKGWILSDVNSVRLGIRNLSGLGAASLSRFSVEMQANTTGSTGSGTSSKNAALFLNTQSSSFNQNVVNSVIAGGNGITATQDDTLYAENLHVMSAATGTTIEATQFFRMVPYTSSEPSSPSDNDIWFHSGATGQITLNYRVGGTNYNVELAP